MGARTDSALLSSVGHGQQLGLVLRALAVRCRVQGWGRLSLVLCEEQLACMWTGGQGPRGFQLTSHRLVATSHVLDQGVDGGKQI